MKKKISLLLGLLLCLSLCACGARTATQPAAQPMDDPVEKPIESRDFFCLPMEYGRLYAVTRDGQDLRLLWDENGYCSARQGDQVYASFEDGTVRRFDGKTGETATLFTTERAVSRLRVLGEDDLLCCDYSMMDGGDVYRWRDGQLKQLVDNDFYIYELNVTDNVMVYDTYGESGEELVGLDLDTGDVRWRVPGGFLYYRQDDTVLIQNDDGLFRVSGQDGSLTPETVPFDPKAYELLYMGSGGYLVEDGGYVSGTPGVYFADDSGLRKLDIATNEDSCSARVLDAEGDLVLLRSYVSAEYPALGEDGGPYYYSREYDYLVDTASGSVDGQLNVRSETTALFADGDFPVLDSSTARKPVTRTLYDTFCLTPGIPGSEPVCNTTHGAWLALADRTSDLALLAAPTEKEQNYLKEKGVEAEMKLYGGDGLVFIGSAACGVEGLTLEQVRGIYRGEITNWSELGGADAPIRVLYRDDQSGSQRLFESMVWGDEPVPDFRALGFDELDAMSDIVDECLYDPYSIGYSIMTYLSDVYGEEDLLAFKLDGVEAAPGTVEDGTYPLGTRGYVVIRADEAEDSPARRLYNWFGSPICDEILTQNGITPLHE